MSWSPCPCAAVSGRSTPQSQPVCSCTACSRGALRPAARLLAGLHHLETNLEAPESRRLGTGGTMARRITAQDLYDLRFVSAPQLAPDGARAACVVTDVVPGSGAAKPGRVARHRAGATDGSAATTGKYEPPRYRSRIHLFDVPAPGIKPSTAVGAAVDGEWPRVSGAGGVAFTTGEYADFAPRFSPDGTKLAFLAQRTEKAKPQLYVIPLEGGEAVKVTDLPAGVGDYVWLPDSQNLAFVSHGDWTDLVGERGLPRRVVKQRHRGDGHGFLPDAATDIYLVPASGSKPEKLTDNSESAGNIAASADGKTIYFTRAKNAADHTVFKADIVAIDVTTRKERIVANSLTGVTGLAPAPDGATLAFLASSQQAMIESHTGAWLT